MKALVLYDCSIVIYVMFYFNSILLLKSNVTMHIMERHWLNVFERQLIKNLLTTWLGFKVKPTI